MIQKQTHWIPYELKARDVERRILTCELLLQRRKRKSLLHRIVNGNEKWIQYGNLIRIEQIYSLQPLQIMWLCFSKRISKLISLDPEFIPTTSLIFTSHQKPLSRQSTVGHEPLLAQEVLAYYITLVRRVSIQVV